MLKCAGFLEDRPCVWYHLSNETYTYMLSKRFSFWSQTKRVQRFNGWAKVWGVNGRSEEVSRTRNAQDAAERAGRPLRLLHRTHRELATWKLYLQLCKNHLLATVKVKVAHFSAWITKCWILHKRWFQRKLWRNSDRSSLVRPTFLWGIVLAIILTCQ